MLLDELDRVELLLLDRVELLLVLASGSPPDPDQPVIPLSAEKLLSSSHPPPLSMLGSQPLLGPVPLGDPRAAAVWALR